MDTAPQWPPQDMVVKPMEEICQKPSLEKKVKPKQQSLNCPRCNSTNTKFCYYNNYSLSQPRYFCKTCRRYWTEGGSLRNIHVGGGSRKNKRPSSSSSSSSLSSKKLPDLVPPPQNPSNLGFLTGLNFMPAVTTSSDPGAVYSSGFPSLPHFKLSLNFSLDGLGSNYGSFQGVQETNGKLLFPFEDLKQVSGSNNGDDRDQQHGDSSGYWNGVIGGGGSW